MSFGCSSFHIKNTFQSIDFYNQMFSINAYVLRNFHICYVDFFPHILWKISILKCSVKEGFCRKNPWKGSFCRKNPSRSYHKQHSMNTQFPSTKMTCYLHHSFLLHISNGFCCVKLRISKDLMSLYRNIAYMLKSKPIKIWINLLIWFFWMPHMRHTNKLPRSIH